MPRKKIKKSVKFTKPFFQAIKKTPKIRLWKKMEPIYTGVIFRRGVFIIRKHPFTFFLLSLILFFLILAAGNLFFRQTPPEEKKEEIVKTVSIYQIGESPKLKLQGKVEKSGILTISAQTPGVVQKIHVEEGEYVKGKQLLVSLSTNYQGGNALSVQRQIAQTQFKNIKDTFDTQKELIKKQKELADKSDANSDQLREISARSISETNDLINLNQSIIDTLNTNQRQYESTNSAGMNEQLILQTKQLRSQFQAANNQLRSSVRQTEYQSSSSNPPAQMSDLQKEIALKQLELQEKALELNKEVSRLQVNLAAINEAMMFPVSPCSGVIQKIHVKLGQVVGPGTPLVTLSSDISNVSADVLVPNEIARSISRYEMSTIWFGTQAFETYPVFVSSEAVERGLYAVKYSIPEQFMNLVPEGGYLTIEIPIGNADTTAAVPFVPIDAIFQNEEEAYIYVVKDGLAKIKKIELGDVVGSYVEVISGLGSGDQIILNRNVIEGERVRIN